jgi:hypothetical protein
MRLLALFCLLALPVSADTWLTYSYSGGFAGLTVKMTISEQGEVVYETRADDQRHLTLSSEEMRQLHGALPATLPASPPPVVGMFDGIDYVLKVGHQEVKWGTGQPFPQELAPLLEQLQRVESRATEACSP